MSDQDEPLDYDQFMQQVAEEKEAPVQFTSKVQTKLGDIQQYTQKQMTKTAKQQLNQHQTLQLAQQNAGAVMVLGAPERKKVSYTPQDQIQKALQEAGLDSLPPEKNIRTTNFEQSDSSEIDFDEFLQNKTTIKQQSDEIIRLRLKLKQNATKLQRWAKIKSKTFRKIHNRERRIEKMQRITDKLQNASDAAKIAGMQDLAEQLVQDKNDFINKENNAYETIRENQMIDNNELEGKTALNSLKFIQKEFQRGNNNENNLLEKADLSMKHNKVKQIIYEDYADNPFLIEENAQVLPEKLNYIDKLEKPVILNAQLLEVASDDEQQKIISNMFEKDEIQELKENDIIIDKVEILAGWGEWTGAGASEKDKFIHRSKVQKARMKEKVQFDEQMNSRTDLNTTGYYENQKPNPEVAEKYQSQGIKVSTQVYEKYIKQSLLPEFQSISNIKFQTQEQFKTLRGEQAIQQREIEQNVQKLQKIQRQYEDQKKLIKGKMIPGGLRKNHFD